MGKGKGRGKGKGGLQWPDGLAGIASGGLFGTSAPWVDLKKAPGFTSQTKTLGLKTTAANIASLRHMFWSPNLVWFTMALAYHLIFPYDIEAATAANGFGDLGGWAARRFALNYAVALIYYGFFFAQLYLANAAGRKYQAGVMPTAGNMLHNAWYWSLAIVQWTFWEAVVVRLWASGAVDFASDAQVFGDVRTLALNVFWVLTIPVWRDVHFYVAHRFLHIRAVYTYVHKLHHRNADPEPFSGLTMHPVEHLYYFSCAFVPSIYVSGLSPLILIWNWVHLSISPGCGHSGFEDHWQSDQYHYVHHAKFECNYGSPMSACIDQFFGTFRESLGKSDEYTGAWTPDHDDNKVGDGGAKSKKDDDAAVAAKPAKAWSPHGYLGLPASWDVAVFNIFTAALFPLVWLAANGRAVAPPAALAAFIAYSPPLVALLLSRLSGDKMSWRWPFAKDSLFGAFGLFLGLGWLLCIVPVHHACTLLFAL